MFTPVVQLIKTESGLVERLPILNAGRCSISNGNVEIAGYSCSTVIAIIEPHKTPAPAWCLKFAII